MKVAILCGGFGTRIRGVADDIPKPMIQIGEYPILWHIMKYYSKWNHKEFVLSLGYKANVVKDFFLNYEAHTRDFSLSLGRNTTEFHSHHDEMDWKITFVSTGLKTMTGGRVGRLKKYLMDDEHFMLTYGDGLSNIDLDRLLEFHKSHGKIMTVSGVRPPSRFGELKTDPEGRVIEFTEKPQSSGGSISGGFFVCRREIFEYLGESETLILEREPMVNLAKDRQMMVYHHEDFWHPMDTYRDYTYLNDLFAAGEAPWTK